MPAIVEFPTIVQDAIEELGVVFANEPERHHFGEYLTGLFVVERKSVLGIHSEFAITTDRSCLNRWITEVEWDEKELNERRLGWLQHDPSTRYSAQGVIAIDDPLIDPEGKLIEDVGWFWDHADQRHLIAHNYLIANYVCTSGQHYALEFRRFRKGEDWEGWQAELAQREGGVQGASEKEQRLATFKGHTEWFKKLVDGVVERQIPGDFAFDGYFTNAEILNHLNGTGRGYVGDLKFNRKLWFKGVERKALERAKLLGAEDRKGVEIGDRRQWYFTKTIHIPGVDHAVRES